MKRDESKISWSSLACRLTARRTLDRLLFEQAARMARVTIEVTPEKLAELLAELLGELPPEQLRIVFQKITERLEVREWMRLGESGLREWLNEADLYSDASPVR